jgi:hypothetical protein
MQMLKYNTKAVPDSVRSKNNYSKKQDNSTSTPQTSDSFVNQLPRRQLTP